jgi:hypothetical protein
LECSSLPDPLNEPEINTFLSLLSDDPLGSDDEPSLDVLFKTLPNVEKVIVHLNINYIKNKVIHLMVAL